MANRANDETERTETGRVVLEDALAKANGKSKFANAATPKTRGQSKRAKLDTTSLGDMNADEIKKSLHIPGIYKSELSTENGTATRTRNLRGWSKQADTYEKKYTSNLSWNTEHVRTKKLASNAFRDKEVNYASGDKLRTVKLSTAFGSLSYKYEQNAVGTKNTVGKKILTYSYELGEKKKDSNTRTETIKKAGWSTNRFEVDDKGNRTRTGKSGWGHSTFTDKDENGNATTTKKRYFGLLHKSVMTDPKGNKIELARDGLLTSSTRTPTTSDSPGIVTKKAAGMSSLYKRTEAIPPVGTHKLVETKMLFGLYKNKRMVALSPEEVKQRDIEKEATRPKTWTGWLAKEAKRAATNAGEAVQRGAWAMAKAAYDNPWKTAAAAVGIAAYATTPFLRAATAVVANPAARNAAVLTARNGVDIMIASAVLQQAYQGYQNYWRPAAANVARLNITPLDRSPPRPLPTGMSPNGAVPGLPARDGAKKVPTTYEAVSKWIGDAYNSWAGVKEAPAAAASIRGAQSKQSDTLSERNVRTINAQSQLGAGSTAPSEVSYRSMPSRVSSQRSSASTVNSFKSAGTNLSRVSAASALSNDSFKTTGTAKSVASASVAEQGAPAQSSRAPGQAGLAAMARAEAHATAMLQGASGSTPAKQPIGMPVQKNTSLAQRSGANAIGL